MAMHRNLKSMPNKPPRINHSIVYILLVLLSVGLAGCSKAELSKEPTATPRPELLPILEIKTEQYTFSMYPQYETESQSHLKLYIRDASGNFVRGANVKANLVAKDGHQQQAFFKEDTRLQKYIAQIPLNHHEDYVIDTSIELKESGRKFTPKFWFHCCDPIPELLNEETSIEGKRGAAK